MKWFAFTVMLLCQYEWIFAQQSIRFTPQHYSNVFSARPVPVLRIKQGDTVITSSVDAVGLDKNGARVAQRGNPLTGPFYIEGAEVGDVVAVTLHKVSLSRNYATTLNALIPKVLPKAVAKHTWRSARLVKWQLDVEKLTGSPADTILRLRNVTIPLHPFLGCVGVAPEGDGETGTGASGPYGGNLDFCYNTTGATVYLPVFHSGALLYLGDGHAAQGDGELNGDALETSMDFSFSVKVLKRDTFPLQVPMVENADYLTFFGIESSLDKSLKVATESLLVWLQQRYSLTLMEASQVIGPVIEYRIPKVAATKVEVAALIPKAILGQIQRKD